MCIEEVTSYQAGDKIYKTRGEAAEGMLNDLVATVLRNHADNLVGGLIHNADKLIYLLNAHPSRVVANELVKNSQKGPVSASIGVLLNRIQTLIRVSKIRERETIRAALRDLGFEDFPQFAKHANRDQCVDLCDRFFLSTTEKPE